MKNSKGKKINKERIDLIYLHSQLDEEQLCSGQEDGLTGLLVLSVFPPLE